MEKKYVTTIVLEHTIEEDEKSSIMGDLSKRLIPKGTVQITVDSITVQEAPANMQPDHMKFLLNLEQQYKQQQDQYTQEDQYVDEPEPLAEPEPEPLAEPEPQPQPQPKQPKQIEEEVEAE